MTRCHRRRPSVFLWEFAARGKKNSPTCGRTRTSLLIVTSSLPMAIRNSGNSARVSVAIRHAAIPSKWSMRWANHGPAGGWFSR